METTHIILSLISTLPTAMELMAAGMMVVVGGYNIFFRTFITYILINPETGQVYIGRTSGFGDIMKIILRRMYNHKYFAAGFTQIEIDRAAQGFRAKFAIRGREQQLIDYFGGIGHPNVANIRRGVSKANFAGRTFHNRSDEFFGNLTEYTGYF